MYSEQQYINQSLAEIAVLKVFGLPEVRDDFTGESLLAPHGIHAVLHLNSGVPQDAKPGDLLVLCEIDEPGIRIHSVSQLADDGSLKPFIEKPRRVDLPTRIAKFLAARSSEAA
jgi:hypothetical protein